MYLLTAYLDNRIISTEFEKLDIVAIEWDYSNKNQLPINFILYMSELKSIIKEIQGKHLEKLTIDLEYSFNYVFENVDLGLVKHSELYIEQDKYFEIKVFNTNNYIEMKK